MTDETSPRDGDGADGESADSPGSSGAGGSTIDWFLGGPTPEDRPGPSVDVPAAGDLPTGDEVPADVQRAFWTLVLVVKVGLLAVALGAMLAGFRGDWRGGVLVAGGAVLLVRAFRRARAFEHGGPTGGE